MSSPAFDLHRVLSALPSAGASIRVALRWAADHTGLPIVLIAALALTALLRLLRWRFHFALEVILATAILAAAQRLGWVRW